MSNLSPFSAVWYFKHLETILETMILWFSCVSIATFVSISLPDIALTLRHGEIRAFIKAANGSLFVAWRHGVQIFDFGGAVYAQALRLAWGHLKRKPKRFSRALRFACQYLQSAMWMMWQCTICSHFWRRWHDAKTFRTLCLPFLKLWLDSQTRKPSSCFLISHLVLQKYDSVVVWIMTWLGVFPTNWL